MTRQGKDKGRRVIVRRKLRWIVPAVLCLGLAGVGAGAAFGSAETITADTTCCSYDQASYNVGTGEVPTLVNPSVSDTGDPHDATAKQKGPDGKPLFRSADIDVGHSGKVSGTQYLAPGVYPFECMIHGPPMDANLVIVDDGPPVARPKIDVKVPVQTLNKVRNTGKLTVTVKALTKSNGISLVVKKGSKLLGTAKGLNISAGKTKTVTVHLGAAGKSALKGLRSASVKATGAVPFGKPDSASRNVH
jgi:hypothetical protein